MIPAPANLCAVYERREDSGMISEKELPVLGYADRQPFVAWRDGAAVRLADATRWLADEGHWAFKRVERRPLGGAF